MKNELLEKFRSQIDNAVAERQRNDSNLQGEVAAQSAVVHAFVDRAKVALGKAVEAIQERAADLGLAAPVVVDGKVRAGRESVSADVSVSMTPSNAESAAGRQIPFDWNWRLSVDASFGNLDGLHAPNFRIDAKRGSWSDGWNCDLPTPECNPKGLTLTTSGEEVAQRFMAWFTRYLAGRR